MRRRGMCIKGNKAAILVFLLTAAMMVMGGCGKKQEEPVAEAPIAEEEDVVVETAEEPVVEEPAAEETPTPVPEEDPAPVVYLIVPQEEGPSETIRYSVEAACRNASVETKLEVRTYEDDIERQTAAFDEAIEAGAALIVCDNGDNDATTESAMKAKEANIPVFLLGRGIESMGVATYQILTDSYSVVRELCEAFVVYKGEKSNYIEIIGEGAAYDTIEAFNVGVAGKPDMMLVASDIADETDEALCYDLIWEMLNSTPEADALICYNGLQTRMGIDAAADLGRDVTIVCLYGDDEYIEELVENGYVFAAVVKPASSIADLVSERVFDFLTDGTLPEDELIFVRGALVVTPEAVNLQNEIESNTPEGEDLYEVPEDADGIVMDFGGAGEGLPGEGEGVMEETP